ncbi:FxSxx-COOH system tetratricopeptide repeat protein [Amycolatopsis sp. NPDC004625]|uniref:FxSxx-COOH system tetratricopeptide repeat protein n=1 Tax=Amycolatopsis sp. NPDC004625 TaxID=3154670 RepID=UPI0033B1937F
MAGGPAGVPDAHDLTWRELADALLLASVMRGSPPKPAPASAYRPPGTAGPSVTDPGEPGVSGEPGGAPGPSSAPGDRVELVGVTVQSGRTASGDPRAPSVPAVVFPFGPEETEVAPAPPALPRQAELIRALRPFKQKVRSLREEDVELDEARTAENASETGRWFPITTQGRRRWLDLTVVIDAAPSLALWRSTVADFVTLLERLGAFRSVQLRLLDTGKAGYAEDGTVLGPVLRGGTSDTPARGPAELLDPSGSRVVLVLTDGVGDAWRRDLVSPVLALWARAMPVAIVNLMPQRLWRRGGLELHRALVTVRGALRPNRRYHWDLLDGWLDPEGTEELKTGAVPVPVLELGPRWLRWWAGLVTGGGEGLTSKVLLARDRPRVAEVADEPAEAPSARDRVKRFRSLASPPAYRLATLLAAVPVSVGVARALQTKLVSDSGPAHLAEVFTSGLLEPAGDGSSWEDAGWRIPAQVREVLLSGARRSETVRAVDTALQRFGGDHPALNRLREALIEPDSTPDPDPAADTAEDVALERAVMRALSGPYLSRADRLDTIEAEAQVGPGRDRSRLRDSSTTITENEPVSDTMSQAPDSAVLRNHPDATQPVAGPPADDVAVTELPPRSRAEVVAKVRATERHERRPGEEAPPVWGAIPPRNANFTGRRELLDQLGQRLGVGTTAVLPAALHGMGGIGKTQMAVEYIYRHLQDYEVVWWIQATQPTAIRTSLTELAQHLRLEGADEAITAVPAVLEALRIGAPYRRWLLVFDSAEDPDVVRPFFPVGGTGEILVTSRNPDWAGIARPLEVAVFEREESKLLLGRRGPELADEDADRIAEKLGDLPLAIEQAAAWLAETGMSAEEYLRLFDEKVAEILDTSKPRDYEVSVAAAWNVSFDELSSRSPAAHQLLQVCAFFAPEPITRSLFAGVRGVSISPELDAALRDPMRLARAVRDINRYGLAKIDHRSDTILLHRLVQLVLRNRMSDQHRLEMRHGAHMLLANLDPNDPSSPRQWPRYQEVLPHINDAELVECTDGWVRQLVINLFRFLHHWGDHQGALNLAELAVRTWEKDRLARAERGEEPLDDPPLQELEASERLAYYQWSLGKYTKAAETSQRTLSRYLEAKGQDSEETLNAQLTYALILKAKGQFADARRYNEETYLKARGLFGQDDPIALVAAHDFVIALLLTGEYQRASELAEDTYNRRVEVFGFDNVTTIGTQVLMVIAKRELGDYAWARIELENIAERAQQLYGGDSVGTLRRRYYQAVATRKDGDHEAARALSADALRRFRIRYGNRHPNAMACALGHSIDLRHAREFGKARSLGEQVFDLYRESLGEKHPHTLSAALDLGVSLRLSGDPASARVLDERSLEEFRSQLGEDHPHTIVCAINVASDLFALDRIDEAAVMDADLLERTRRVLGTDHPTTLAVQLNRSIDLRVLGETAEADRLYEDVMVRYRLVLSEDHPGTINASQGIRADCDIDPMPM